MSMRIFAALGAVVILTLSAAAGDAETCAEAKVDNGGAEVLNACTRLIESAALSPEQRAQAYVNRATQNQLWNNNVGAITDYDEVIRLDPDRADAYFERGTLFWIYKKDPDRALADFNDVIRLTPNDAKGYMGRGTAYAAKNDLDHALTEYDTAIDIDPKDVPLFSLRAFTHERKGDLIPALADYRHAATMVPRDRDEIYAIKQAFDDFRRVKQMLSVLGMPYTAPAPRRRRDPFVPELPFAFGHAGDRASCENIGGVAAEAILSCTRLIASGSIKGSELATAHVWRGSHLGNAADRDGAIDDYDTALKIDSKNLAAHVGRAVTYEVKGEPDRALAGYRDATTLDPSMKYAADAVKRLESGLATKR